MRTILIISPRPGAGKTAVAAAFAELARRDGKAAGYLKAVESGDGPLESAPDARFFGTFLGGGGTAATRLGHESVGTAIAGNGDARDALVQAVKAAGEGKDLLVVEGPSGLTSGISLGVSPSQIAEALDAQVLVVARYEGDQVVDDLLAAKSILGDRLFGAVVSDVPKQRWTGASERLGGFLREHGVRLLGLLPHDERLASVSVAQLAEHLGGQIMNSQDKAGALIESFMVGTVVLGKASDYFRRRSGKAVIAHGSRPDMHLAALETDTRCLVLAGNVVPNPIVVARAEEEEVPLIMVKQDTLAVLEQVEELFTSPRFDQASKVGIVADLLATHVDLSAIRPAAQTAAA